MLETLQQRHVAVQAAGGGGPGVAAASGECARMCACARCVCMVGPATVPWPFNRALLMHAALYACPNIINIIWECSRHQTTPSCSSTPSYRHTAGTHHGHERGALGPHNRTRACHRAAARPCRPLPAVAAAAGQLRGLAAQRQLAPRPLRRHTRVVGINITASATSSPSPYSATRRLAAAWAGQG